MSVQFLIVLKVTSNNMASFYDLYLIFFKVGIESKTLWCQF